ncbi:Zn-ribbon domain-containing OB-fold protein [Mycobacterium kyogaense]|uniref:Zn-ribbon domain-containing OB-fold protein n=1 Tax=Mycobacterium kyogaense TaxID=2212479 RepID=UPI000DAC3A2A|nr:OB-fold domain-containing protein [Mycobacterium kyogaense]
MRAISELLPDVSWEPLKPFWAACAQREMRFPQCVRCGRFQWYPRDFCAGCMGEEFIWAAIDPVGTVYSFTVVRRAFLPGSRAKVPFTVLQVQFDEAPGVTLLTNLADESQAPLVRVGSRVVASFTDVDDPKGGAPVTMPWVRIVESS